MEKERKIKSMSLVALIVAVLGLTVAFAAMSRTLTINGTATMDTATWDIHFEGVSGKSTESGGVTTLTGQIDTSVNQQNAATVVTAPTIQADANGKAATVIGTYSVKLTKPGDVVSFEFDVVNNGTIDADLFTVSMPSPTCTDKANHTADMTAPKTGNDAQIVCSHLVYTLKYANGDTVQGREADITAGKTNYYLDRAATLNSNPTKKRMILTIGYDSNADDRYESNVATETALPSDDVEITGMDIVLTYTQRATTTTTTSN